MKKQLALITSVALLATMANSVAWAADGEADVEYTQFPLTMECEDMEGAFTWGGESRVGGRRLCPAGAPIFILSVRRN